MSIEMELQTQLTWHGLEIAVTCVPNWLNSDHAHIEIRCAEPLPITNTGYRSHFMPIRELEQWNSLDAFLLAWLDEASGSKDWQRIWAMRQQLSLPL